MTGRDRRRKRGQWPSRSGPCKAPSSRPRRSAIAPCRPRWSARAQRGHQGARPRAGQKARVFCTFWGTPAKGAEQDRSAAHDVVAGRGGRHGWENGPGGTHPLSWSSPLGEPQSREWVEGILRGWHRTLHCVRQGRFGEGPSQDRLGPTPREGGSHRDGVRPAPTGVGSVGMAALRCHVPGPTPGPSRGTWPEVWSKIATFLPKYRRGYVGSSSQDRRPIGRPRKARVAGGPPRR